MSRTIVGVFMVEILASRLRECRIKKKLTQFQIASICSITEKTYQNYELMTRIPKLDILIKIADVYGVSIDYLVGRTDHKEMKK